MTVPHIRRGPYPQLVILDEVHVIPISHFEGLEVREASFGFKDVALEWPRQCGKDAWRQALSGELTVRFPVTEAMSRAFAALLAADYARQDRMLRHLATDLGIPASLAREQYDDVVRVLEKAGVADGYGCLTVPQPVRPAPPWPTGLRARRSRGTR
ncbi:hypothetical protein ACFUIY_14680 [Streptomyces griseorubiginosus]|uniref:hypothetical protein n=1 Tax=Streptomyces griseorubiginosus TaxID=67304 RepID=UPI00363DB5C7